MVVLPALSRPSMRMRMGAWRLHQNRDSYNEENVNPMAIRALRSASQVIVDSLARILPQHV